MARKIGLILIVLVLAGMIFGSCATYGTRGGVTTPYGFFSFASINAPREGDIIAEYKVILGLMTTGYEEFLDKTKGQKIDIINSDILGIITTYKAVKR